MSNTFSSSLLMSPESVPLELICHILVYIRTIFVRSYLVSEKLFEIVEEHTNDRGLWIKDPKMTEKDEETKITKSQFKNSQKKNY
jgi:hypothetical protein